MSIGDSTPWRRTIDWTQYDQLKVQGLADRYTPAHYVKKTYVVDTLYVDLIERYAEAEWVVAQGRSEPDAFNRVF